ncbi:MAG: hypothetical protein AAGH79_08050 [Bacteroidota bacterium]
MPRKRKTLPFNFADPFQTASLDVLKEIYTNRLPDAYEKYSKQTALFFNECPHALAEWLVEQGADLEAKNRWGSTPLQTRSGSRLGNIVSLLNLGASMHYQDETGTALHHTAFHHNAANFGILLEKGADVSTSNKSGMTPLELALQTCSNMDIPETVDIANLSLKASPSINRKMQGYVQEIGQKFEFFRSAFNLEMVDRVSTKLEELYVLFEVAPTPRRRLHDGLETIRIEGEGWSEQYDFLWDLLVPATGAAATVQGETIRIVGRIDRELQVNGGINWDDDFRLMAESFLGYIQLGNPLSEQEMALLIENANYLKKNRADLQLLKELIVRWVQFNPEPIPLLEAPYQR